jgi:hypothetical protein
LSDSAKREGLWKDFTDKANSFANWFTSILISNFIYLVSISGVKRTRDLGKTSLVITMVCLAMVFIFKVLGVYAAKERHGLAAKEISPLDDDRLQNIEVYRKWSFCIFVVLGAIAVLISGLAIWTNFASISFKRLDGA